MLLYVHMLYVYRSRPQIFTSTSFLSNNVSKFAILININPLFTPSPQQQNEKNLKNYRN